jgi:hypothetical protein
LLGATAPFLWIQRGSSAICILNVRAVYEIFNSSAPGVSFTLVKTDDYMIENHGLQDHPERMRWNLSSFVRES